VAKAEHASPGLQGFRDVIVCAIRRTDPDTPLIAVTAAQDAEVTRAVLDAGVTELLLKPFSLDDLAAAIARAARQKL